MSFSLDESVSGSGFKIPGTGGSDLVTHRVVYLAGDGKWYQSNASNVSTMPVSAITSGQVPKDKKGEFLLSGLISLNMWNWTPGGLLYASTVAGQMTQTRPSGSGNQVQVLGRAFTKTLILFDPDYVLVEVA